MKNPKMLAFCIIAIIVIVLITILALMISGNSSIFYLCLGIVAGVVISKLIINKKSKKK